MIVVPNDLKTISFTAVSSSLFYLSSTENTTKDEVSFYLRGQSFSGDVKQCSVLRKILQKISSTYIIHM